MVSYNTKRKDRRFQVYEYFAWLELILFIQVKLWERLTHFILQTIRLSLLIHVIYIYKYTHYKKLKDVR